VYIYNYNKMTNKIENQIYFPSNVFKNILDYCGEPLPKNGTDDRRGYEEWIKTPEGIIYSKIDGQTLSVQKIRPKKEVLYGMSYIREFIQGQASEKHCLLVWFRSPNGNLNNRYEETTDSKRRNSRKCVGCGIISLKNKPKWKDRCDKCYYLFHRDDSDSGEEIEELYRLCITCNNTDLSKEPNWKKECIKCYYKNKKTNCLLLTDSDDDE